MPPIPVGLGETPGVTDPIWAEPVIVVAIAATIKKKATKARTSLIRKLTNLERELVVFELNCPEALLVVSCFPNI